MAETTEEIIEETPVEEPAADELPADDPPAEEEQPWRTLTEVKGQMDSLLTEVRTCNQRAQDQAATVSQLLATNQELTRQLTENNQLLSIRALSTDPEPSPTPSENLPKPSDPKPSESDEKPATESEPPVDPPAPAPAERVQRRRRSI